LGVTVEVTVELAELERRLRVLEDIEAIKQLKYRYADACDRGYDSDTLADLFTIDAIWEGDLFGRYEGREAIREFFRGVSADIPFASHYMMNPIISVDGDEATGEWYLFQTCTFAEGNTPILGAARYADRYRRADGAWKFRHVQLISTFWTPYEEGWVRRPFVQEG
jgi:ketosteroid isomerase-like protein